MIIPMEYQALFASKRFFIKGLQKTASKNVVCLSCLLHIFADIID